MKTILKTAYWKILKLFYYNKLTKFHLREIARRTGLYLPSASKFLEQLEKDQVLVSEKEGNLKKYFVLPTNNTYLFFEHFDIERLEKLPSIRKNSIERYLQKLSVQPIFVVLFGSTAKENYQEESDIDLLLVSNSTLKTLKAEQEVESITGLKISSFQITYSKFLREIKLKEDKVVQSALTSGYPIINNRAYYKVVYDERIRLAKTHH